MSATLLKGAPVATAIGEELNPRIETLTASGVTPTLAIVRVGQKEDDLSYERGAMKRCATLGLDVRSVVLEQTCTQEALMSAIQAINEDDTIHGCLLLRPLPKGLDEEAVCAALAPEKDVDGITPGSMAGLFAGNGQGYPPCTAQACVELLNHYNVDVTGKRVTVVGRSLVIGKPVAMLLLAKHATVTVCHTRTVDLPATCRQAEILVVAAGQAEMAGADFVAPHQIVVDVGIHVTEEGKLCGDVRRSEVEPVVEAMTPVPAGVGSVTTAVLCAHVVSAAERFTEEKRGG